MPGTACYIRFRQNAFHLQYLNSRTGKFSWLSLTNSNCDTETGIIQQKSKNFHKKPSTWKSFVHYSRSKFTQIPRRHLRSFFCVFFVFGFFQLFLITNRSCQKFASCFHWKVLVFSGFFLRSTFDMARIWALTFFVFLRLLHFSIFLP